MMYIFVWKYYVLEEKICIILFLEHFRKFFSFLPVSLHNIEYSSEIHGTNPIESITVEE